MCFFLCVQGDPCVFFCVQGDLWVFFCVQGDPCVFLRVQGDACVFFSVQGDPCVFSLSRAIHVFFSLSRAIHVLFPSVSIKRKKVQGVRDTYYGNLRWKKPTFTPINASAFTCPPQFMYKICIINFSFSLEILYTLYRLPGVISISSSCWC